MILFFKRKQHNKYIEALTDAAAAFIVNNYKDAGIVQLDNIGRFSLNDNDENFDEEAFASTISAIKNSSPDFTAEKLLDRHVQASFSEALAECISQKGLRDARVYKAASVDRRLYSKIKSNSNYKPSKDTCIKLALALNLSLEDTKKLISRAGYTLSHSIKRDLVIEYCIREKEYSLLNINDLLFRLGMEILE